MFSLLHQYNKSLLRFTTSSLVVFGLLYCLSINAQQLDNIKDQQPLTINGFVSTNQVLNTQPTDSGNITSYNAYYTGTLNFNVYGINTPLTFIYTNQQGNFSHPFNQYALHPSYKWVKAHIGYASMSFSPYTLSNHIFCGVGVEASPPGIFRASAMYGRLKRAIDYDSLQIGNTPAYHRVGYALKLGVVKESDKLEMTIFKAKDNPNSIVGLPDNLELLPEENTALSLSGGKRIGKTLMIQAEIATSSLTTDLRTPEHSESNTLLRPASWFMPMRESTINRNAYKANISHNRNNYSIGATYEKIDPEYRTLGAYYFTNNLENITLNGSLNLLESKLALSANGGLQRDNLDNTKLNNNIRYVGSGNANYTPGEKLNLNVSYSNFTSYTNVRSTFDYINETDPYENYDTLNFRQISQNTNLNTSYQLSSDEKKKQNLNLNLIWQVSDNTQGQDGTDKTNFYNGGLTYIISFVPVELNISTSLNYNRNETGEATTNTGGLVFSVSKVFFEKTLRSNLTTSYNISSSENMPGSNTFNLRMGLVYTLLKQHNINLNLLYQRRDNSQRIHHNYNLTFGYAYNFSIIGKKEQVKSTPLKDQ